MNTTKKWVLAAMAGLALTAGAVRAQETQAAPEAAAAPAEEEKAWSLEFGLDYSTLYMFRGINLLGEDQEVWTPRVVYTYGGFSAWYYGYYGKFDQFDEDGEPVSDGNYGEEDFGLDYTFEIGKMSLTLGGLTYMYPGEVETRPRVRRHLGALRHRGLRRRRWRRPSPTTRTSTRSTAASSRSTSRTASRRATRSASISRARSASTSATTRAATRSSASTRRAATSNHAMLGLDVPWQITDSFSMHAMVQQFWSLDVADDLEQPDETVLTVGATFGF